MPTLPQHERLLNLAEDLVARLFEESKIAPAIVALARLRMASLRTLIKLPQPTAADLISLVDTTDFLIDLVVRHAESLYTAEKLAFQTLRSDLTGIPACRQRTVVAE